mmetsp:Transcript_21952/g.54071  ORF Transcript_21952/g.54071 Transcript_21952/m.54071 type:complete len:244 (+) Transcript_21952:699-1430(+)
MPLEQSCYERRHCELDLVRKMLQNVACLEVPISLILALELVRAAHVGEGHRDTACRERHGRPALEQDLHYVQVTNRARPRDRRDARVVTDEGVSLVFKEEGSAAKVCLRDSTEQRHRGIILLDHSEEVWHVMVQDPRSTPRLDDVADLDAVDVCAHLWCLCLHDQPKGLEAVGECCDTGECAHNVGGVGDMFPEQLEALEVSEPKREEGSCLEVRRAGVDERLHGHGLIRLARRQDGRLPPEV